MKHRLLATVFVGLLGVLASCGGSGGDASVPTMPDVVGKRLDVANSDIERAGIDGETEILGGGTFGVVDDSNWTVCEQLPAAGSPVNSPPRLIVDRSCPTAATTTAAGTDASTSTSAPPTTSTPPVQETLTVENSPDLAALLTGTDCGGTVASFVEKYRGRTIEFDGNIANVANHDGATTRYDFLVYAGDYSEVTATGPNLQFRDVSGLDMNLTGGDGNIEMGDDLRFVAEVEDFDSDSCLLLLTPVSTRVR
jgi:hypothetical protein